MPPIPETGDHEGVAIEGYKQNETRVKNCYTAKHSRFDVTHNSSVVKTVQDQEWIRIHYQQSGIINEKYFVHP